ALHVNAELCEKLSCQRSGSDASGCFSRRSPLEYVAEVAGSELLSAGEVCVAGPRPSDDSTDLRSTFVLFYDRLIDGRFGQGLSGHHVLPVNEVTVLDHHRDRRADRATVSNAGEKLDLVRFDLHPPAASVTLLAPPQFVVDRIFVDRHARRQSFDDHDESLSM